MELAKKFMEMTTYGNMADDPQRRGSKQPALELPADPSKLIPLPPVETLPFGREPLIEVVNARRSLRQYAETALTLQELAFLLWCCQGVQQKSDKHTLRTVPSAGARHALETYVLINRVQGLSAGLYRYSALNHALLPIYISGEIAGELAAACLGQGIVTQAAVTLFWAAEVQRMYHRYGERGYRYLHLDAGHACQNLCLAAEAVLCGAVPIGAYGDEALNELIGLDSENSFVVYAAAVGKKAK